MKSSSEDKAEGQLHQAKGKLKAVVGDLTGNEDLQAEGEAENAGGKVQEKVGEVKKVFGK